MHPARNWSHRFSHAKCLSPDCSTAKSEQTPLYCRCWSLASNLILVTVSSIIRISRKYNPSSVFFYYFVTYTFTTNVKDFLNVVVISVEIVSIKLGWPKYRVHHKGKPSLYTISRNVSTISRQIWNRSRNHFARRTSIYFPTRYYILSSTTAPVSYLIQIFHSPSFESNFHPSKTTTPPASTNSQTFAIYNFRFTCAPRCI